MSTTTVFAATTDGNILSQDAAYANARAGTGGTLTATTNGASFAVGQRLDGDFLVWEGFLNFDLLGAGISPSAVVSAAELALWVTFDGSTTDFTLQARAKDWGAALTTADFVAGADLGSLTLLASVSSAGASAGAYLALTENGTALRDSIAAALAGDGILRVLLCSSRTAAGTQPADQEFLTVSAADEAGTTQDPKLTVTHAAPPAVAVRGLALRGRPFHRRAGGRRVR